MSKFDRGDGWMRDDELFSKVVVESAKRDIAPPGTKEQMLAALGLQAKSVSPTPSANTSYAQKLGGYYLRGVGFALVAAAAAVVAASYQTSAESTPTPTSASAPASDSTPTPTPTPTPSAEVIVAAPTTGAFVDAPPVTTPADLPIAQGGARVGVAQAKPSVMRSAPIAPSAAAPPLAAPPAAESTLGRETLLVTGARSALAAGDFDRTLSLLDAYDKEFSSGAFVLEVAVLRIEALARSGRHDEARQLGDRFVAKHPRGALARRVAITLGDVAPVEH